MQKLADIYINIPVKSISTAYTYIIPKQFDIVSVGCRVIIPFGNRTLEGFIVKIHTDTTKLDINKLKPIIDIIDTEAWFTKGMYQTAKWMSNFYLCSLGETMRLFIPGKNSVKIRPYYSLNKHNFLTYNHQKLSSLELQILNYLQTYKNADLLSLRRSFSSNCDLTTVLNRLIAKQLLTREYTYQSKAKKIYENFAVLTTDITNDILATLKRKPAQKKALLYLQEVKTMSTKNLAKQKISLPTLKSLAELGYIKLEPRQILRDSYQKMIVHNKQKRHLTLEQQRAIDTINKQLAQGQRKFLLFGVTGSGKTQVYIELALKTRAQGKQALILVPEIVLTGQLVTSFKEYFPDDVVVIHSRLSLGERNDTFLRIRTKQVGIIIGARSALFAPFDDLGLIVMDEEHDSSYKQDESPRYHSHDIVEQMSDIYQATLLMGSATPSLESYYKSQQGKYTLLTMPSRIDNLPLPQIEAVDMREELRLGNRKILSWKLRELIADTLAKHEQIIIMLNRRGFATFVMCRACGHVIKCPQCGIPLVYHRRGILQCHHCDITVSVPDICPNCNSKYIKFFGSGTEKLEEELALQFPQARIIRLDRDTTGKKFAHQDILNQFKSGLYDILLGTQMVAKGHDIPNVTAVGIISADSSLNLPDFRSGERCFGLITQTAGRAGRGDKKGQVVVQTYNLEHYAVQNGIKQDYQHFYEEEINLRRLMYYPPFCHLIKLVIQHEIEEQALIKAKYIKKSIEQHFINDSSVIVMGPAPSLIAKFKGIYRFNLLLKTKEIQPLHDYLKTLKIDTDNTITIDVNPINTN